MPPPITYPTMPPPAKPPPTGSYDNSSHLPKGQCQYLLLHPEMRGQRCSCVRFSLHRSTPGSSCDCGHQAVYHLAAAEGGAARDGASLGDAAEMSELKDRVRRLESLLEDERHGGRSNLSLRLHDLEELVDRSRAEMEGEVKTAYRGIEGLWHNVGLLQKRARVVDDRIDAVLDTNQGVMDDVRMLQGRLVALDDAEMRLEDRVDALTDGAPTRTVTTPEGQGFGAASVLDVDVPMLASLAALGSRHLPGSYDTAMQNTHMTPSLPALTTAQASPAALPASPPTPASPLSPISTCSSSSSWTVHVSLLPTAHLPFPYERDTLAYKRCLSRGLHRTLAIPTTSASAFTTAILRAFAPLLHARAWMPLVPKICDAESLRGLPMLRQLPSSLVDESLWDLAFLRRECATLDHGGRVLDLYLTLRGTALSWAELRKLPVFLDGLEEAWEYDPILDGREASDVGASQHGSGSTPRDVNVRVLGDSVECAMVLDQDHNRAWAPPTAMRRKRSAETIERVAAAAVGSYGSGESDGKRARLGLGLGVERSVAMRAEAV